MLRRIRETRWPKLDRSSSARTAERSPIAGKAAAIPAKNGTASSRRSARRPVPRAPSVARLVALEDLSEARRGSPAHRHGPRRIRSGRGRRFRPRNPSPCSAGSPGSANRRCSSRFALRSPDAARAWSIFPARKRSRRCGCERGAWAFRMRASISPAPPTSRT